MKILALVTDRQHPTKIVDVAEGLTWSSDTPIDVVGVTIGYSTDPETTTFEFRNSHLAPEYEDVVHSAFVLKQLVELGRQYDYVIFLNSNFLVINRGVDKWLSAVFDTYGINMTGVGESLSYEIYYNQACKYLSDLGIPHEGWESPPRQLGSQFLVFDWSVVELFYAKGILAPENYNECLVPYGVFASWCATMLGKTVLAQGATNMPMIPIFCGSSRTTGMIYPSPTILSPRFILYHPVNKIMDWTEFAIRRYYQEHREKTPKIK